MAPKKYSTHGHTLFFFPKKTFYKCLFMNYYKYFVYFKFFSNPCSYCNLKINLYIEQKKKTHTHCMFDKLLLKVRKVFEEKEANKLLIKDYE